MEIVDCTVGSSSSFQFRSRYDLRDVKSWKNLTLKNIFFFLLAFGCVLAWKSITGDHCQSSSCKISIPNTNLLCASSLTSKKLEMYLTIKSSPSFSSISSMNCSNCCWLHSHYSVSHSLTCAQQFRACYKHFGNDQDYKIPCSCFVRFLTYVTTSVLYL